MSQTYNLLHEPWIDVVTLTNQRESVGILDLFRNAHLYRKIATQPFHKTYFVFYDYLVLRLACGILTDAYRKNRDIEAILSRGAFVMDEGSELMSYFAKYEGAFDLIAKDRPFLQTGAQDIRLWQAFGAIVKADPTNILALNPVAPAASARINELKVDDIEGFKTMMGNPYQGILYSAIPENAASKTLQKAIVALYLASLKEWAYIVLYHNSVAPGVGAGNKAALAGKAYYAETIEGANLFESITMNSASMLQASRLGTPQWRWGSQTDGFSDEQDMAVLSGLFFPSKILCAGKVEDGKVLQAMSSPLRFKEKSNRSIDALQQTWAMNYEPHFIVDTGAPQKKTANRGADAVASDTAASDANPYRKAAPASWLMLLGATQTATNRLTQDDVKTMTCLAKASRNTVSAKKLFPDEVCMKTYYRVCTSKWVYCTMGVVRGVLPRNIFLDEEKQVFVKKAVELICASAADLNDVVRGYLRPDPRKAADAKNRFTGDVEAGRTFHTLMEGYMGVDGRADGLLRRISLSQTPEQMDALWWETVEALQKNAASVFEGYFRADRTMQYFQANRLLQNKLYQKGKSLYG